MKIFLSLLCCLFSLNAIWALSKNDCKCRAASEKKIVGGRIVPLINYPWQTQIGLKNLIPIPDFMRKLLPKSYKIGRHNCGSSIINERWILTAGHCIPPKDSKIPINLFRIGYGFNDLVKIFDENKYMDIEQAFVHPKYNLTEYGAEYDIALIKLKKPLKFSKHVQPACLPSSEDRVMKYDGILKISGYGAENRPTFNKKTHEMSKLFVSRFLKEALVYDNTDKEKICKHYNDWQNICVSDKKTDDTACKGDSGGPLHQIKNGKSTVIGIASYVSYEENDDNIILCNSATAYTRISAFLDFVKEHVGEENYCT